MGVNEKIMLKLPLDHLKEEYEHNPRVVQIDTTVYFRSKFQDLSLVLLICALRRYNKEQLINYIQEIFGTNNSIYSRFVDHIKDVSLDALRINSIEYEEFKQSSFILGQYIKAKTAR